MPVTQSSSHYKYCLIPNVNLIIKLKQSLVSGSFWRELKEIIFFPVRLNQARNFWNWCSWNG
jgi:hypothetical protein